jgi:5'-3' exonuclease
MRLSLIDLSSIFWSAWHSTAGQDIDAAARVSLERVRERAEGFDAVVVCCDVGRSFRHDLYPQYKANRPPRDAAAYDQLRRVREQLAADGISTVAVEGYEADDVIATLAMKAPGAGYDVVIHSADKDLCQLVGPAIVVQSTSNGGTTYDAAKVEEKFRVRPSQLGDFLALVGDKSDNIAGCPGCGEVNAARLLTELGSLANMLEQPDTVTPQKMREALVANKQQILLARKLVQLRTDVPIDFAEAIKPREPKPMEEPVDEKQMGEDPDMRPPSNPPPPPGAMAKAPEDQGNVCPPQESAALVLDKGDPRWALALEPRDARGAYQFAKALHASQLYRAKFPNAEAIFAVILRGRSLGLDMMTSLDGFHVIEGKPCMTAMLGIAVVKSSGKAEYFELVESTSESATWRTKRKDEDKEHRMTFTIRDAHRIGLDKPTKNGKDSNWVKWPGPMCRKQAGFELARAVYPDVINNLYDPDEIAS